MEDAARRLNATLQNMQKQSAAHSKIVSDQLLMDNLQLGQQWLEMSSVRNMVDGMASGVASMNGALNYMVGLN
ncbi:MAG: hypothetical protein E7D48_04760 [Bifidobacterium scardovii]|uniref:hypothetical protein n=1 Tax=Bifidobacterium scardovii TaxID=158787 RepID=UPI0029047039|nr:hypothetical protein [Bifidobacterium scardovii]MDU2421410.1 hypothetical protein [Bifidobacterium scardovii]